MHIQDLHCVYMFMNNTLYVSFDKLLVFTIVLLRQMTVLLVKNQLSIYDFILKSITTRVNVLTCLLHYIALRANNSPLHCYGMVEGLPLKKQILDDVIKTQLAETHRYVL